MAFADLEDDEQMVLLANLGREALAAWDLEAPELEAIKYRENAVFAVRTAGGGKWVLRVHRPRYRSDTAIRSEFAWTRALDAAGIAVPQPLATRSGDLLTVAAAPGVPEARQCDLIAWVEGAPPGTLEGGISQDDNEVLATYREVGSLAARIQTHGEGWTRPADFSRPSWNLETLVGDNPAFGRFEELDCIDADKLDACIRARALVRERVATLGPAATLVHGDLLPDNLLVDGDAIRVIDFDDCGWSWPGMEMVTSLFPLQISGGFEAGLAGYLEGYRRHRPFPEKDLALLPDLMMARTLSYLGWPVGRPEIHSVKMMAPFMAAMIGDAALAYLTERG